MRGMSSTQSFHMEGMTCCVHRTFLSQSRTQHGLPFMFATVNVPFFFFTFCMHSPVFIRLPIRCPNVYVHFVL